MDLQAVRFECNIGAMRKNGKSYNLEVGGAQMTENHGCDLKEFEFYCIILIVQNEITSDLLEDYSNSRVNS